MQVTAPLETKDKTTPDVPPQIPVYPDIIRGENTARRIISVCRHYSAHPLETLTVLQLGASTGILTESFARHFRRIIAIDTDLSSLQLSHKISRNENIEYICLEGNRLAVADDSIDVIICDRYLEHTEHQQQMMEEIYRTLKYNGFCYFGATSKYAIVEQNYNLPFLSWFPKSVAELYLKLAGIKGTYDPNIISLDCLNKLTKDFWRHDYTGIIRRNPKEFFSEDIASPNGLVSAMFKQFYPFLANWIWILTKRR